MISKEAMDLLDGKLARARQVMIEMMEAKESGIVTIGFGPQGLRFACERNEPPTSVNLESKDDYPFTVRGIPRR